MPADLSLQISTALGDIVDLLEARQSESVSETLREIADSLARLADKAEEDEGPEPPEKVDFAPLIAAIKAQRVDLSPLVSALANIAPAPVVVPAPEVNITVEPAPVTHTPAPPAPPPQLPTARVSRILFNSDRRGNIESAEIIWEHTT